eukprot:GHVS01080259.1.p1 GENE.GHVS01080259.1~~GHVS01080259.1.p1  ORF type:complete len:538 (-),score=46.73 GHVS01080259.1:71-1684(-)
MGFKQPLEELRRIGSRSSFFVPNGSLELCLSKMWGHTLGREARCRISTRSTVGYGRKLSNTLVEKKKVSQQQVHVADANARKMTLRNCMKPESSLMSNGKPFCSFNRCVDSSMEFWFIRALFLGALIKDPMRRDQHRSHAYRAFCSEGRNEHASREEQEFFRTERERKQKLGYRTYYDVLCVRRNASELELKKAYMTLAKRFHPDTVGKAEQPCDYGATISASTAALPTGYLEDSRGCIVDPSLCIDQIRATPWEKERPEARTSEATEPTIVDRAMAAQKFQEIQDAYSVLGTKWKRLMYDNELAYGGEQPVGTTAEAWAPMWDQESDEERMARRDRYRRYANEERNDAPRKVILSTVGQHVCFVSLMFLTFLYAMQQLPDAISDETDFNMEDDEKFNRNVKLVAAFHNPVGNRWEEIPEGYEAPSCNELLQYYSKADEDFDFSLVNLPLRQLTVTKILQNNTTSATVLRDKSTGNIITGKTIEAEKRRQYAKRINDSAAKLPNGAPTSPGDTSEISGNGLKTIRDNSAASCNSDKR